MAERAAVQELADKVFDTTGVSAVELAGGVNFKPVDQGVWAAKLVDGTTINVRSVSSSQVGRWTVDVQDNPSLQAINLNRSNKYELKFK